MKAYYKESLLERGATLVALEKQADICIVDDARKNQHTNDDYYSYKFIDVSVKANALENLQDYRISPKPATERPVGSVTTAAKRRRNPFTKQDDQILREWLDPIRRVDGYWRGNEIYKQLAREHPQHTFQSWRERYLNLVKQGVKTIVPGPVPPAPPPGDEETVVPQGRSSKRRRLNSFQSAAAGDMTQRSPLSPTPTNPASDTRTPSRSQNSLREGALRGKSEEPIRSFNGSSIQPNHTVNSATAPAAKSPERDMNAHGPVRSQTPRSEVEADGHSDIKRSQVDGPSEKPKTYEADSKQPPKKAARSNGSHGADGRPRLATAPAFSRKDQQSLYKAVPYIHSTDPNLLEQSWKEMAAKFGDHSWTEWRSYYENVIRPEYMRRNDLETESELGDHVHDFLAKEQTSQTGDQQDARVDDEAQDSESEMFFKESPSSSQSDDFDAGDDNDDDDADVREASPELGIDPQIIQKAIQVKSNGRVVVGDSHLVQSQDTSQPEKQLSTVSPKRKLFGRILDSEFVGSQAHEQQAVSETKATTKISFSAIATESVLAPSNSQSIASSKTPPESGQRPPKSTTISQEEPAARDFADNGENNEISILDVLAATDKLLEEDSNPSASSRASSPLLDLVNEASAEAENVPSSPALSDTGSEYVSFDTGPERSQLWDPSQSQLDDDVDSDEDVEGTGDDESFEMVQSMDAGTPLRPAPSRSVVIHNSTPMHETRQSRYFDKNDPDSDGHTDDEASAAPEIQSVLENPPKSRLETQALFQQSFPVEEEDTSMFDVPPPDGGWEQFSDVEDDLDDVHDLHDVHKSVESPDHVLDDEGSLISRTEEDDAELRQSHAGFEGQNLEEVVVVSENGSSHTTDSIDFDDVKPTTMSEARQQQPRHRFSFGGSVKSSHLGTAFPPDTSLEGNEDESSASDDQAAIESWFSRQALLYETTHVGIVNRLASTALQATIFNLPAATFTMRDLIKSFRGSEASRQDQFKQSIRIKREHTDSMSHPIFKPKMRLTEEEAKAFLPQDVLGVWTINDDRDFLSRTLDGLKRVEKKHGSKGVKKRARFLKMRYGQEASVEVPIPRTAPNSAKRLR